MSITTPINGFQLPSLGDTANIETAVRPLGLAVDSVVVPRFSTTSARDAAITSPTFGQMAAVSSTGELYYYNGTAWIGAVPRYISKLADETVTSSTALQDDNHLVVAAEANSRYIIKYVLFVSAASNAGDLKINWTLPSGSVGRRTAMTALSEGGSLNFDTVYMAWSTSADLVSGAINGFNYVLINGVFVTGSNAGNIILRWAQNSSSVNGTTLTVDSYLEALKVG